MAMTTWLIDNSALMRLGQSPDAAEWRGRIDLGRVRITTLTYLELGYSARNAADANTTFTTPPITLMPIENMTPAIEDRAHAVQMLLVSRGQHRAPSIPDLLIAATAELSGLTVLHVDKDFDLIAEVTGQACERLRL